MLQWDQQMTFYPEFGKFIALSSNTSIIGDCKVGNNVLFGGNSFIINKHIRITH